MPRNPSVLIVEPNDDQREVYVRAFAAAEWDAAGAETGSLALAKAIVEHPSIVVTGLRLAGIDGCDLIGLLRRDPDTRAMPIIAIADAGALADDALIAGATAVLPASCPPAILVARSIELVHAPAAAGPGHIPAAALAALRATAAPAEKAASVNCPECRAPLARVGVLHTTSVGRQIERWVEYRCPRGCGGFEYRQRTRRLRKIS